MVDLSSLASTPVAMVGSRGGGSRQLRLNSEGGREIGGFEGGVEGGGRSFKGIVGVEKASRDVDGETGGFPPYLASGCRKELLGDGSLTRALAGYKDREIKQCLDAL